jgi:hypothetical protein
MCVGLLIVGIRSLARNGASLKRTSLVADNLTQDRRYRDGQAKITLLCGIG